MAPLFVATGDGDAGALSGEEEGCRFADARGRAGDQSNFVF
jgi:hypothetical protein